MSTTITGSDSLGSTNVPSVINAPPPPPPAYTGFGMQMCSLAVLSHSMEAFFGRPSQVVDGTVNGQAIGHASKCKDMRFPMVKPSPSSQPAGMIWVVCQPPSQPAELVVTEITKGVDLARISAIQFQLMDPPPMERVDTITTRLAVFAMDGTHRGFMAVDPFLKSVQVVPPALFKLATWFTCNLKGAGLEFRYHDKVLDIDATRRLTFVTPNDANPSLWYVR